MDNKQLENLISEYKAGYKVDIDRHLEFYKNLNTIEEAIENAPWGKDHDIDKHKHQWRVPIRSIELTKDSIMQKKNEISICKDFDEIRNIIKKCRAVQFGKLATYDTALRIAAYLNVPMPKVVYLHRGTKDGARSLGLGYNKRLLYTRELPKPLQELEPYDIEAFLCVFRKRLINI